MKPFDLKAAKRGDAVVTRDGRAVRFVAHVPEAVEEGRIVAFIDGSNIPDLFCESGLFLADEIPRDKDLFMRTHTRTIYLNLQRTANGALMPFWYEDEAKARALYDGVDRPPHVLAIAAPVEISE